MTQFVSSTERPDETEPRQVLGNITDIQEKIDELAVTPTDFKAHGLKLAEETGNK